MGKHGVHDGTNLAVDEWWQGQRPPRVGSACQQLQCRQAIRGYRDDRSLATAATLAEYASVEHPEGDPAPAFDTGAAFGASHERRRMADQPEHGQLGVRDQCPHEAVGEFSCRGVVIMGRTRCRECSQRGVGDIEQFRLRIAVRGERVEQFSDIHAAEKRCLAPSDPKSMLETGFRQQVERIG